MKLKDLLLEKPADYVDGNADDKIKLLRRKQRYDQFDGVGATEAKDVDESHHDKKEGKMAKYDAKEIAEDAVAVFKMIDKDMDLPEWLEAKITKSADYMNSVKDYLTHHMKSDDSDNENKNNRSSNNNSSSSNDGNNNNNNNSNNNNASDNVSNSSNSNPKRLLL